MAGPAFEKIGDILWNSRSAFQLLNISISCAYQKTHILKSKRGTVANILTIQDLEIIEIQGITKDTEGEAPNS